MANTCRRPIFRDYALHQYIHKQERDVLPRLVSPPTFVCHWMLLGLLLFAGYIAWWVEIPTHVAGTGVVLSHGFPVTSRRNEIIAVVFLPASASPKVQAELPIQLRLGTTGPTFTGQVERVEPGIISPAEAFARYSLAGSGTQVITQPSFVLLVRVGPPFLSPIYAGSIVHAQIQIGSQRVLSLFSKLIGGGTN